MPPLSLWCRKEIRVQHFQHITKSDYCPSHGECQLSVIKLLLFLKEGDLKNFVKSNVFFEKMRLEN